MIEAAVMASPLLTRILERWDEIRLPDCWLVAGAVAQTYWNHVHRYPPLYGIKDVDIVYFDATNLSEAAEARHSDRIKQLFEDMDIEFDIKNEARVHLWYEQRFGYSIPPYTDVRSAIESFPTTAGAIGIRPWSAGIEFIAPYGLDDLVKLIVRPVKKQITAAIYREKVERWKRLWPELTVLDWSDG